VAGGSALNKTSGGEIEIPKAKEILDADHYDLQKVKDVFSTFCPYAV